MEEKTQKAIESAHSLRKDTGVLNETLNEKAEQTPSESKNKDNSKILLGFLLFIIVISAAAYYFVKQDTPQTPGVVVLEYDSNDPLLKNDRPTQYVYNDYTFKYDNGLWNTIVTNPRTEEPIRIDLHRGPRDLQSVARSEKLWQFLNYALLFQDQNNRSGVTYVMYPPDAKGEMGVAFLEVYNNLQQGLGIQAIPAFTNNNTELNDVPIKSCDDTEEPIIWLRHESPTQVVYREPNCLIVQGEGQEIWKAENLMLYIFYGIIPN